MSQFRRSMFFAKASIVACIGIVLSLQAARAERPSAPELLPETTLAFVRIPSVPEMLEKFQETSLGKISQNEKIRPLIGELYGSVSEAFAQIQDEVGVPLGKILALPQGELCIALVAQKTGPPVLFALMDVGESEATAKTLIERAEKAIENDGAVRSHETVGSTRLTIYNDPDRTDRKVVYFNRDETIVITSNVDVAKQIVERWDGKQDKEDSTLADNRRFTTIMSKCRGTKDERPHLTWFVDPIELARVATRGNSAAQLGLAILPALGLDGIQAVGGSFIYAPEEFDGIVHMHVLLESPRAGIIELIQFDSGDIEPEDWVPADTYGYTTFHFDVSKGFDKVAKLFDSFNGDDAWGNLLKRRVTDRVGVDIEKELLDQFDGRFTLVSWIEQPVRANSQVNVLAIKLKDADAVLATIKKLLEQAPADTVAESVYGGVTIYQGSRPMRDRPVGEPRDPERPARADRLAFRRPEPCLAIVDGYLMLTGSRKMLEEVIKTNSDATAPTLAKEDDYDLIATKIKRHLAGTQPSLITFNRPEEAFRLIYDLVESDDTRRNLATWSEGNEFVRKLNTALNENPLPPFAELAKYLAPGGGILTDDETGIHYIGFALKGDYEE